MVCYCHPHSSALLGCLFWTSGASFIPLGAVSWLLHQLRLLLLHPCCQVWCWSCFWLGWTWYHQYWPGRHQYFCPWNQRKMSQSRKSDRKPLPVCTRDFQPHPGDVPTLETEHTLHILDMSLFVIVVPFTTTFRHDFLGMTTFRHCYFEPGKVHKVSFHWISSWISAKVKWALKFS